MENRYQSKCVTLLLSAVLLIGIPNYANALTIMTCDGRGGQASVVLEADPGKWVGFSARTSSGTIIDVPPRKIGGVAGVNVFNFKFNRTGDVVEGRASTWDGRQSNGLMKGRRSDTGWVSCE